MSESVTGSGTISELVTIVKTALRVTTTAFDSEITLLVNDCLSEMRTMGILVDAMGLSDFQIQSTVIAYVKWRFGDADNKDDFERIYHTKLAQLMHTTNYVNWEA